MNSMILFEIVEAARDWALSEQGKRHPIAITVGGGVYSNQFLEKYVQLIVEECTKVVDAESAVKLRKYFGIDG
jgi:hypothetical protein